jgi:hypothetical protein
MFMETTTIASALVTAITTIAGDATNAMVQIVPVAAPIMGGLLVITVAIKTFKKFKNA